MSSIQEAPDLFIDEESLDSHQASTDPLEKLTEEQRRLVEDNINIVLRTANPYRFKNGGQDFEDILQEGYIGLIQAASRFNPYHTGVRFGIYAGARVSGAIEDYLREQDFLSRHYRKQLKKWREAEGKLSQQLGHVPSAAETATYLGLPQEAVDKLFSRVIKDQIAYLEDSPPNGTYVDEREANFYDIVADEHVVDEEDIVGALEFDRLVNQRNISDRERDILKLYFLWGYLQSEIGVMQGVEKSRISQIITGALAKLALRKELQR